MARRVDAATVQAPPVLAGSRPVQAHGLHTDGGAPRRPRPPPLTKAQRRAVDRRTASVLERAGLDPRPPHETALRVVETGARIVLEEYRPRWVWAGCGHARASEVALNWDAFQATIDLSSLRHVRLRPKGHKAQPGQLASELARFSRDLDRHVGRLVTSGLVQTLLTSIHLRYDTGRGVWDIHAHCMWLVDDENCARVWSRLEEHFFDPWHEKEHIRQPGALANYILYRSVDHHSIDAWPSYIVTELWNLQRAQLHRCSGLFAAFRRDMSHRKLRRVGSAIVIEDRRPARPRPVVGDEEAPRDDGVVAYTVARIGGQATLCQVERRAKPSPPANTGQTGTGGNLEPATVCPGPTADAGAAPEREGVHSVTENLPDSPRDLRAWGSAGVTWRDGSGTRRFANLPWRCRWWLEAWPSRGDRLTSAVRSKVLRLIAATVDLEPGAPVRRPTRAGRVSGTSASPIVGPWHSRAEKGRGGWPRRSSGRVNENRRRATASPP